MKSSLRHRIGYVLEEFTFLDWITLRYDGIAPNGRKRYINRINGHVVVR